MGTEYIDAGLSKMHSAERGYEGLLVSHIADQPLLAGIARNFIQFPEFMEQKASTKDPFSDKRHLLEMNMSENLKNEDGEFQDWKALWGSEEGKIGVVMGAGPSLLKHLPFLEKHRDKLVLIGVNRVMRAIKPHYYVNIERRGMPDWYIVKEQVERQKCDHNGDGNCVYCDPIEIDTSDVKAILTPQTDWRSTLCFKPENRYWAFQDLGGYGDDPAVGKLTSMDMKASTTTAIACYVAYKLGVSKLILTGMDFAVEMHKYESKEPSVECADCRKLSKDKPSPVPCGKEHQHLQIGRLYFDKQFGETNYATRPTWRGPNRIQVVEGIDGKVCGTNWDFRSFEQFQRAIVSFIHNDGDVEVVNCSGQGLLRWDNTATIEEATGFEPAETSHYQDIYDGMWMNSNYHNFHMSDCIMEDVEAFCEQKEIKTVLDIGCGPGRAVKMLKSKGFEAKGFDCSSKAVEFANDEDIVRADLPDIPFDGRFDLALCTEVLEHVTEELVEKTLHRLRRQAEYAIITIPHQHAGFPGPHMEQLHETVHDRKWWREKLQESGKVIDEKTVENSPVKSTMFTLQLSNGKG